MARESEKIREFARALPVAEDQGFSKWAVFTHAWHESGAFKKVIGSHNYWGIKKPRKWTGKTHMVTTHEYIKGEKTKVQAEFIDFGTAIEAVNWYCGLIRRIYPGSYRNRHEPARYFVHLVSGKLKYATDPNYPTKLISLYRVLYEDSNLAFLIDHE